MTVICDPHAPAYGFSAQISIHDCSPGLTKRELFAAMAMQGILSRSNTNWARMEVQLAEQSVRHADALIAELSK